MHPRAIALAALAFVLSAIGEEVAVHYSLEDDGQAVRVLADGRPLFQYLYVPCARPELKNDNYSRSGYIHPVWTPSGKILTDDWAGYGQGDDHWHHRGVWFAWTKTEIGGKSHDFWNLGAGTGKSFFVRFAEKSDRGFVAEHEWKTGRGGANTKYTDIVLRERWTARVAAKTRNGFLLDLVIEQTPLTMIHLPVHHYGGLAFRGATQWQPQDAPVRVLTSEGEDRVAGDQGVARWWHAQGNLGDGVAGFAMFDHPSNKNHPSPMRLNPDIPYFGFFPFKRQPFTLQPNQPITFRYRLLAHDGEFSPDSIEDLWQQWIKETNP